MHLLARLSLRNRALIVLVCVFVSVFGVLSMTSLKQELIPSVEFPQISVSATNPGASPEVMDEQVARPLESALQGVEGLDSSTATSNTGSSLISLTLAYGTDLDRARSQVDRAISNVASVLPEGVKPTAFAGSVADLPVIFYAVEGKGSLAATSDRLNADVVPALQKLDGVRQVSVSGAASQYVQILPDAKKLKEAGLSDSDVATAVQNAGRAMSLGTLADGSLTLPVQTDGAPGSIKDIESLRVTSAAATSATGAPSATKPANERLGDIAKVKLADEKTTTITRTNGAETLSLTVTKTPEADTVKVSQAVRDAVAQLSTQVDAKFTVVFDQAPSITDSIHDLTVEGLLGLLFAVLVILVFLMSLRSTLVTAISIPLSLLATFIGIAAFGFSLNMLTLGALTISIGRVVDDSIVVIENIKRHLSYGGPRGTAILTAVKEVSGAVTASTLTTVAVFLPIAFVGGLAGELFRPFAITVALALTASLLVSLTIVPVLAYWFLRSPQAKKAPEEAGLATVGAAVIDPSVPAPISSAGPVSAAAAAKEQAEVKEEKSWLQRMYVPVLRKTQHHPVITLLAAVIILGATLAMTPFMKFNLLGGTGQQAFTATLTMPAGTSLEATDAASSKMEKALKGVSGVENVQVTIGSAGGGMASMFSSGASDAASFTVTADPKADLDSVVNAARTAAEDAKPGGDVEVSATEGGGFSSTVTVQISAPTPEALKKANDDVLAALSGTKDTTAIESNLTATRPQVQVSVDRQKAADLGLSQAQIAALVNGTLNPLPAGQVTFGFTNLTVSVGEGQQIKSISDLEKLKIPSLKGEVPLSDFATVKKVEREASITTQNADRIATVSITPTADGLRTVSAEVTKRLDELKLSDGASATLGGAATQQAESFAQLGLAMIAAIAIVYVIMVATFKSLRQPLILLVSIPFAATGAIALTLISQVPIGLASLIGMLMLIGIVVTNAIVLIDLINQYRRPATGRPAMNLEDAIMHGARRRLRPILMTALATIFAMIPMALGVTGSGGFISQPLAIVVIGGLVSSTLLTLILVPVLYRLIEGRAERRRVDGTGPAADGLDDVSLGLVKEETPEPATPEMLWTGTIDAVTGLPRPSRGRHAAIPATGADGVELPH